jgi:hypothetical protein
MRLLLAALCALALSSPALAAVTKPPGRVYTPADAAREMRAATRVPRVKALPVPKPKKAAPKPRKPAVRRAAAPAKRAWKPKRTTWRARRPVRAVRRRTAARPAAAPPIRRPYEPPPPVFIGDLHIQADDTPLWSSPAGGQLLGRLPRATIVTNMGNYGAYYKIEAPNGAVGFVRDRHVGSSAPSW